MSVLAVCQPFDLDWTWTAAVTYTKPSVDTNVHSISTVGHLTLPCGRAAIAEV